MQGNPDLDLQVKFMLEISERVNKANLNQANQANIEAADNAIKAAFPAYQSAMANFRIGDVKGYLVHAETDEYYAFYHGINTTPSPEQIAKFNKAGVKFVTTKPNSPNIHPKKILKNQP